MESILDPTFRYTSSANTDVRKTFARIRREPDDMIIKIVSGWSERIDAKRALQLGFKAETSFDDIVRIHIEDELGGKIAA